MTVDAAHAYDAILLCDVMVGLNEDCCLIGLEEACSYLLSIIHLILK